MTGRPVPVHRSQNPSAALSVKAVLFDLDGTLIDSAPDLAGAGNDMRIARGLPPYPVAHFRPLVGSGARGMVGRAFEIGPADVEFHSLRDEFLTRYEARMTRETAVFPGMRAVLDAIAERGIPWGIVTNKAARFSEPLVRALVLKHPPGTLICGDTTAHSKPHPEPLLEAARRLGVSASTCVYVGDDLRDVQAGRAAGMATIAVRWGYLGEGSPIESWAADHVVESASELLRLLGMA